jgi:uncharacterized lipoprotein YddW (UPF0748 family)
MRTVRGAPLLLLALSSACAAPEVDPRPPTTSPDSSSVSGPSSTQEAPLPSQAGPVAPVAHVRELRGVWISTAWNGTWPSRAGLPAESAKAELVALFDALSAASMNAVFLQVRPESDALYPSTLEPWSRFLTGTQGKDPGFDPLAFAIEIGHARGLEVHAWMNPFRALTSTSVVAAENHVTRLLPDRKVVWGSQVWMDPGAPEVRARVADVVRDILARYDVDGVHFDDYFYPYPIAGAEFPDDGTYLDYQAGGGTLGKLDWRRANVNALIRGVAELVAELRPDIRFGVSPFGIYRPGTPAGVTGLDAYDVLASDPVKWMDEGWVDYVAPQLYWPTTQAERSFTALVAWWATLAKSGRSVFAGHDLTRLGQADYPLEEYEKQMSLSLAQRDAGVRGDVFFTAKALAADTLGVTTSLRSAYWARPAATPKLATATGSLIGPSVTRGSAVTYLDHPGKLRSYAIYRFSPLGFSLDRLVPFSPGPLGVSLASGKWAVSAIDRRGVESVGVMVEIP